MKHQWVVYFFDHHHGSIQRRYDCANEADARTRADTLMKESGYTWKPLMWPPVRRGGKWRPDRSCWKAKGFASLLIGPEVRG